METDERDLADSSEIETARSRVTRRLAGQSALLLGGNVFTLLAGFPFQIYLARTLGADGLGVFGLMDVVVQTITSFGGLGLGQVVVRFIPKHVAEGKSNHVRTLLRLIYLVTFAMSLLAVAAALAVYYSLGSAPAWSGKSKSLVPLMSLMIPVGMLLGLSQQVLRSFLDVRYVVIWSSFLQLTFKILLTGIFFFFGLRLSGYVLAVVLSSIFALLGMAAGVRRHLIRLPVTADSVLGLTKREWLGFAKISYGSSLLGLLFAPAERFLLAACLGAKSVGVLVIVRQLQGFPQIFLQVLITVVSPLFAASQTHQDLDHLYHLATDWLCRLAFPLLLFLAIFSGNMLDLYGKDFSALGKTGLLIILAAQLINFGTGPIGNLLNMQGCQKQMILAEIVSTTINLVLILMLVPLLGIPGAMLASALNIAYVNLAAVFIASKHLHLHWSSEKYTRWLVPLVATVTVLAGLKYFMRAPLLAPQLIVAVILGTLTFHLFYVIRGFDGDDKQVLRAIALRLFPKAALERQP